MSSLTPTTAPSSSSSTIANNNNNNNNASNKYNLEVTRKVIKNAYFDPSNYIGQQISSIAIDGVDPEIQIFQIFEELTKHLTELSEEIEDEVRVLQCEASNTESMLLEDLDHQLDQLEQVGEEVDVLKYNFDVSSEGAMSIGGKLSNFEKERHQVTKSIELLSYIQEFEEHASRYQRVTNMNAEKLKSILPGNMSTMSWDEISHILHDLNRIMNDMNKPEVENAQQIIINITEVVETELLGQFDNVLHEIMESATASSQQQQQLDGSNGSGSISVSKISKAKSLASTLHLYNNGLALQKRYIFSVIQKRIPSDAFFTGGNSNATSGGLGGLLNKFKNTLNKEDDNGGNDDDSSAGASQNNSDDEDEGGGGRGGGMGGTSSHNPRNNGGKFIDNLLGHNNQPQQQMSSFQLLDHLSGLFTMINRVCLEQFDIIRQVFPPHTIARITRLLVQRIFSDPAFGIQARVDAILCPQPPSPPLSLSDYLDALLTVREKLTALNLLLIECTSDASMIGMGSESASLRKSKKENAYYPSNGSSMQKKGNSTKKPTTASSSNVPFSSSKKANSGGDDDNSDHEGADGKTQDEIDEERLRSDAEIREFFDEQIAQVLGNYVTEYFDKEITHIRQQYVSLLRKSVDGDMNLVSSGTVLHLPHVKAERMKSITQIVKSITKSLLKSIFAVTTDAICRMESIGRDDKKKLPIYIKEICLLQLGVCNEGILLPALKQLTNILLKHAGNIYKQPMVTAGNGSGGGGPGGVGGGGSSGGPGGIGGGGGGGGGGSNSVISYDVLDFLSLVCYYRDEFSNNFQSIFQRPLVDYPNLLVICKDIRKQSFQSIVYHCKETLYAWEVGIVLYIEKTLMSGQSKFDFAPKFDPLASLSQNVNHAMNMVEGNIHGAGGGHHSSMAGHGNAVSTTAEPVLSPTAACDAVCKIIIRVTQCVRARDSDMQVVDVEHIYWKPFGQQFIALLIAHLRKFKISQVGAKQLLRDLEEYRNVAQLMNSPEALDMMICLEEICKVFLVSADQVAKMVMEEMRHLDTAIVLALVRCRADFGTRSQSDQYTKILGATYSFKWDAPLAWEGKKPLTVMAFNDAFALILSNAANPNGTNSNVNQQNQYIRVLGPKTLRKSSAMPLSALFLSEFANRTRGDSSDQHNSLAPGGFKDSVRISQTGAMSIDLNALDSSRLNTYELDRQSRMLSTDGAGHNHHQNPNVPSQFSPLAQKLISKYLPSRPDEELNQLRDAMQMSSNSPDITNSKRTSSMAMNGGASTSSTQVSRPDLIGIADSNRSSIAMGAKKRPQTMGASSNSDASRQGNDLPPMPGQGNRASVANPPTPSNDNTTTPKSEGMGMFKAMTGFFKR